MKNILLTLLLSVMITPWCKDNVYLPADRALSSVWPNAAMPIYYCYIDEDGDNYQDYVRAYAYNEDQNDFSLIGVFMWHEYLYLGEEKK